MRFDAKAKFIRRAFLFFFSLLLPLQALAQVWTPQSVFLFTRQSCQTQDIAADANLQSSERSDISIRGHSIGTQYRIKLDNGMSMEMDVLQPGGRPARFINRLYDEFDDALVMVSLASDCSLQMARQINYDERKRVVSIATLDEDFEPQQPLDWINPRLEFMHDKARSEGLTKEDQVSVRVALVDSGVNYRIPAINSRLARDANNQLIGYDFWDMDALPYDANLPASGFYVQRHGTRTASILLKEAADIELVPYRYPRPDMSRMKALIEHADKHRVSIIGLPMGSNREKEWQAFYQAARQHAHILFIVSAGNNGRDIDQQPVYPAAFELENLLVVTSANDFARPAERTNWGGRSVDFMVPAERIDAIDYDSQPVQVSGSSYAVSRVTALAARIQTEHPRWRAKEIIAEINSRFSVDNTRVRRWVSSGYIADPLVGAEVKFTPLNTPHVVTSTTKPNGKRLALDILQLDPRWTEQHIQQALQQAFDILGQCDIVPATLSARALQGSDYLRDLSTGNAGTLLDAANTHHATVVFARDTRMQPQYMGEAFGRGNTASRPWLTHSVWLMAGIADPGIALAHELFHVLANNGDHVQKAGNLMREDTQPDNLSLDGNQCQQARMNGALNGLLLD